MDYARLPFVNLLIVGLSVFVASSESFMLLVGKLLLVVFHKVA